MRKIRLLIPWRLLPKKNLLLCLLFFGLTAAWQLNAQSYCSPNAGSSIIEEITHISVGDLELSNNNSSSGYIDNTDEIVNMASEQSYEIALQGYTGGSFTNYFTVWVDWNQDGIFDDDEMFPIGSIYNSSGNDGEKAEGTIEVPSSAQLGQTTMRIIKNFSTSPTNPCGSYSYGQAIDIGVFIEPLDDCTEAEAGQIVGDTEMEVCAGIAFTIQVEGHSDPADGLTRTWQSSPVGENNWTDLDIGSSTLNMSEGVSEATDFRYFVACEDDEDSTDIVTVNLAPAVECYCESAYTLGVYLSSIVITSSIYFI